MCESREAELELIEAAFGPAFNVTHHNNMETVFTLHMTSLATPVILTFTLNFDFPRVSLKCFIQGKISNSRRDEVMKFIQKLLDETPDIGNSIARVLDLQAGVLSVFQAVEELLTSYENISSQELINESPSTVIVQIARFLIYFHHIMSHYKRKVLVENAIDLRLGGYSKPGFPGIVVVEGCLDDVMEYVRRTQRLRWQHMVVRGEEIETFELDPWKSIDCYRKFPPQFYEIEGNMSDLGALCRDANLHDLFMTALKKTTSQG